MAFLFYERNSMPRLQPGASSRRSNVFEPVNRWQRTNRAGWR